MRHGLIAEEVATVYPGERAESHRVVGRESAAAAGGHDSHKDKIVTNHCSSCSTSEVRAAVHLTAVPSIVGSQPDGFNTMR